MPNSSIRDADYDLYILLRNTNDVILRLRINELNERGVLGRRIAVLLMIQIIERERGVATPAEIARCLVRKPHTVSDMLFRMAKDGLIRKVRDLDRKDRIRIAITEEGYQYFKKSAERESIHRILSCLTDEERKQLRACLDKLHSQGIKELGIEPRIPFP